MAHVHPERAEERLREAGLVEVAARGRHRQPDHLVAQRIDRFGAGEQQVLDRRRLKRAVVRSPKHEIGRGPRPRDGDARAEGVVVDDEMVAIPAQAGVHRPRPAADLILDEERVTRDRRGARRTGTSAGVSGSNCIRIRDPVAEALADPADVQIAAGLPLVRAGLRRHRASEIELAKAAILLGHDRRRRRIGPEPGRHVAHHAAHVAEHARRQDPLVRELPDRFAGCRDPAAARPPPARARSARGTAPARAGR